MKYQYVVFNDRTTRNLPMKYIKSMDPYCQSMGIGIHVLSFPGDVLTVSIL